MAAPQGYWLGNKFIFTPAAPPVWPEAAPEATPMAPAAPVVAARPASIFGGGGSDPGQIGNVRQGWAGDVRDNHSGLIGGIGNYVSGLFGGNTRAIDSGSLPSGAIYDPDEHMGPNGPNTAQILGLEPEHTARVGEDGKLTAQVGKGWTGKDLTSVDRTPAAVMGERGYKDQQGREYDELGVKLEPTTPEEEAARDVRDRVSGGAMMAGLLGFPGMGGIGHLIGESRPGDLSAVGPYTTDSFGNYRYGSSGPMGTLQAPVGRMQIGYNPNVATNDFTGTFGLGTVGHTGRSVTSAMFDSDGLGKGGPFGYGYGVKGDGSIGALTANDVDDINADDYDWSANETGAAPEGFGPIDGESQDDWGQTSDDPGDYDYGGYFHEGGFVEGPDQESEGEEFTANIKEGEFVIRPEVVELLGPEFFDRLNKLID